ncbi:DUF4062 domain-containing protein, partial [candidate division KSB1 bacterium]
MKGKVMEQPVVFISSTVEDLRPYRAAAKEAVSTARCQLRMMEYFAAEGKNPPLSECMRHIDECDVLVVIVANRYGWIPKEQEKGEAKSITWLECLHAASQDKEVIAFILDPNKKDWPAEYNEENIIAKAIQEGTATPELFTSVQRAVQDLKEFKKWLNSRGFCAFFVNTHDLFGKVYQSLVEWRERHAERFQHVPAPSDPQLYLEWLREESGYIDIRGLQVGAGKANRFGIEELYIPLTTVSMLSEAKRALEREERLENRRVELQEVLQSARAAIIGEPGAGKTTFLKRISFALCQTLQGIEPEAAEKRLGLKTAYFPIYIRLFELIQHITSCEKRNKSDCPILANDPQWLVHFLSEKSRSQKWKLGQDFWQEKLSSDQVILLLDGLDEAPDRGERERISELISQAVRTYRDARFVLTSRPLAYVGKAVLQEFPQAYIDSLEPEAIDFYLQRWTKAAYFDAPLKADEHYLELRQALQERAEIRKLARNPVMLTALAVVHWNEKRLPEQRADLYDSIITWLLRSRE